MAKDLRLADKARKLKLYTGQGKQSQADICSAGKVDCISSHSKLSRDFKAWSSVGSFRRSQPLHGLKDAWRLRSPNRSGGCGGSLQRACASW